MIRRRGSLISAVVISTTGAGYAQFARATFESGGESVTGWDVTFDVVTNPLFLGQIVLAVWSILTIADLGRVLDPQRAIRLGSRSLIMSRELMRGTVQLVLGAVLLIVATAVVGTGLSWNGWGSVSLSPTGGLLLARAGWVPVPLLAVSVAQAIACLLAVRAIAIAIALAVGSARPAIAALAAFWFVEALSSLYVSADIPVLRYLGPIFSTERVAPLGLTAPVVVGAAVLLIAACWAVVHIRDRASARFAMGVRGARSFGWSGFAALVAAIAVDTVTRQPRTLVEAWSTLLAGHSPDLLAYTLYATAGLGYALAVVHHLEEQLDGRVWIELIRLGNWRKWLERHLARPLLLIPAYLTALVAGSSVAAVTSLGSHALDGVLPTLSGYLLNGSLQIAFYTAIAVTVALVCGEARAAWITLGILFLAGSPFVPDSRVLPIGIYHLDPTWAGVLQQAALLIAWITAGVVLLIVLSRKRVLHVTA